MGRFITSFIMVLSLIFSPLQAIAPTGIAIFSSNMNSGTGKSIELPQLGQGEQTQIPLEDPTEQEESDNKWGTSSFVELDFNGYCTICVPESHFTVRASSTDVQKEVGYKDNKSRITMSYVTHIGSDADIPGYITREVAGVDTTTNNKELVTYGSNVSWMKVPAEERIDGCNIYVYYTLNADKTAAFWARVKVAPDSDGEEFNDVLRQVFDTYSTYGGNGTLFETPDSGIYEGMDTEDSTHGDTSNYKANTLANQVFGTRGGYVPGADISENWQDLEFILDGVKFKLPCTLDDFYQANYEVNDKKVTANHMNVDAGKTLDVSLCNDNGTVITATFYNSSLKMSQSADDCMIMRVIIDSDKFVNMSQAEREARQREREEAAGKLKEKEEQQAEEEAKKAEEEAKKAEEEANKQWVTILTDVNVREKPNTNCQSYVVAHADEKYEYIRMSDDGEWFCVKYEDKEAFIKAKYGKLGEKGEGSEESSEEKTEEGSEQSESGEEQKDEQKDVPKKQVIKIIKSVPLKAEPQSNAKKITALSRGETFDYLDVSEDGSWYKIDYFGTEAWVNAVAADLVELTEEDYKKEQEYMEDLYGVDKEEKDKKEALEKAEQKDENTQEEVDYTSQDFDASYDEYGHQMILAGGVTWPAYADDIIQYYGTGVSRTNHNNGQQLRLQWTQGEKYMTIITGTIKQIYSVELSCVPEN